MRVPTEAQALRMLPRRLAELLGVGTENAKILRESGALIRADAVVRLEGFTFAIEWIASGSMARIAAAAQQALRHASALGKRAIPLVAVPFMGPGGRELCERTRVGWLDLSGNAHIAAPGLRITVAGQPNRYKGPGRPESAFAPKSSRLARWLLMHPAEPVTQRELAAATRMDEGFTSRIVARLEADELIFRDQDGRIRARDPNLLLDAWVESYDFAKHRAIRGHIPARSGEAQVHSVAGALEKRGELYAATGLAAAWLLNHFAAFRIVTIYLAEQPEPALFEQLGFREVDSGANTWLVAPNDEGVFQGAGVHDGVRCVHPVQVYLDLKDQPERAKEAAQQLRSSLLTWSPIA